MAKTQGLPLGLPWQAAPIQVGTGTHGAFSPLRSRKKSPETSVDAVSRALMFGRRDWTRTNDPHHVKVVL
jgi:hypothetical protein